MKTSIKLSAVILLFIASAFTAPVTAATITPPAKDQVFFATLNKQFGISVTLLKPEAGKATIAIYDENNNLLVKNKVKDEDFDQKGYLLNELDNGNYYIEVVTNGELITKTIRVYEDGDERKIAFM